MAKNTVTICLSLSPELAESVRAQAAACGITVSAYVSLILRGVVKAPTIKEEV